MSATSMSTATRVGFVGSTKVRMLVLQVGQRTLRAWARQASDPCLSRRDDRSQWAWGSFGGGGPVNRTVCGSYCEPATQKKSKKPPSSGRFKAEAEACRHPSQCLHSLRRCSNVLEAPQEDADVAVVEEDTPRSSPCCRRRLCPGQSSSASRCRASPRHRIELSADHDCSHLRGEHGAGWVEPGKEERAPGMPSSLIFSKPPLGSNSTTCFFSATISCALAGADPQGSAPRMRTTCRCRSRAPSRYQSSGGSPRSHRDRGSCSPFPGRDRMPSASRSPSRPPCRSFGAAALGLDYGLVEVVGVL